MKAKISFSHNWNNKLNCDIFTTIRKFTQDKFDYYKSMEGETFDIVLNGTVHSQAILASGRSSILDDIHWQIVVLDTGMVISDAMALFGKFGIKPIDEAIILTFSKLKLQERSKG